MSLEGRISIGRFKTMCRMADIDVASYFRYILRAGQPVWITELDTSPLVDELPKLFREANVLYWAKALLGLLDSASDSPYPEEDRDIQKYFRSCDLSSGLGYSS
ncbi:hypothetical protein BDR07DRAFT_1492911 [Suillus spraguei]|nr:hypothetical protein BDR07DRAFT_1492911 [Suillus spraguei]